MAAKYQDLQVKNSIKPCEYVGPPTCLPNVNATIRPLRNGLVPDTVTMSALENLLFLSVCHSATPALYQRH
jgi:hypothetical protein